MNKKLRNMMIALLLATSVAVPTAQAIHLGDGVHWTYGGNYFTTVWSKTVNSQWRKSRVHASVSKNGVLTRSGWRAYIAEAARGGLGSTAAYFDYY